MLGASLRRALRALSAAAVEFVALVTNGVRNWVGGVSKQFTHAPTVVAQFPQETCAVTHLLETTPATEGLVPTTPEQITAPREFRARVPSLVLEPALDGELVEPQEVRAAQELVAAIPEPVKARRPRRRNVNLVTVLDSGRGYKETVIGTEQVTRSGRVSRPPRRL